MIVPWGEVEVGKQYKYEEKYHLQAIVTVLEDKSTKDYCKYLIRFDEVVGGTGAASVKAGDTLTVGQIREPGSAAYLVAGHNFKTLDDSFDYVCFAKPS